MTHVGTIRGRVAAIAVSTIAVGCSAAPSESPWAADRDVPDLPTPTVDEVETRADSGGGEARLIDDDCAGDAIRCGLASVPQTRDSPDRVTLEYRVITDSGAGTPVVQLLDGTSLGEISPLDLPDRPLIALGARGIHPGQPNLSCPEFYGAESNREVRGVLEACTERLLLAGIDPAGTRPSQAGDDVGLTLAALGYDEVDLIVPSWRALSTPHIADHVSVRRVVYSDPWFTTDRATGPAASAVASINAVWARCRELAPCTTPGTEADFLAAIAELDERPLDDVQDTFSDEPRPIDALRVAGAIVSSATGAADLAFLPQLHQAIVDRDAETVSSFVQSVTSTSTEVNLLGVTCSLFDSAGTTSAGLPSPLREDADDGIDLFGNACAVWPSDDVSSSTPLPGLTVFTDSSPAGGADRESALSAGPVVVEPTVGPPTGACVAAAAAAWFDRNEADATGCSTALAIGDRASAVSLTRGVYDSGDVIVELVVPDTWADSGYGIWWRESDPLDSTNLDVYLWEAVDAEAARSEIAADWGLVDPLLSATQIGERIWLVASGSVGVDTVYQIATSRIDDSNVAIILESDSGESTRLADEVLMPALEAVVLR